MKKNNEKYKIQNNCSLYHSLIQISLSDSAKSPKIAIKLIIYHYNLIKFSTRF